MTILKSKDDVTARKREDVKTGEDRERSQSRFPVFPSSRFPLWRRRLVWGGTEASLHGKETPGAGIGPFVCRREGPEAQNLGWDSSRSVLLNWRDSVSLVTTI